MKRRNKQEDKIPRQYSVVKVSDSWIQLMEETGYTNTPLYAEAKSHNSFIFLGDIPNMQGHCIVISVKTGHVFCCYHTDDFEEIPEDET